MRFYFVGAEDVAPYSATLKEAKATARHIAKTSYHDVEVQEVQVSLDRENMLRILNTAGGFQIPIKTVFTAKAKLKRGEL